MRTCPLMQTFLFHFLHMPTHFDRPLEVFSWLLYTESSSLRSSIFLRRILLRVSHFSYCHANAVPTVVYSTLLLFPGAYLPASDMHIAHFLQVVLLICAREAQHLHFAPIFSHPPVVHLFAPTHPNLSGYNDSFVGIAQFSRY